MDLTVSDCLIDTANPVDLEPFSAKKVAGKRVKNRKLKQNICEGTSIVEMYT